MAARIYRLRTRPQELQEAKAEEARQAVLALELPEAITADVLRAIERHVPSTREGWAFVMLSPEQFVAVSRWLRHHSTRSVQAGILWDELFAVLDGRTGEIMATRAKLAEMVGCHPRDISRAMTELERIGAIIRKREGRGVRYFMNPRVATELPKEPREAAQAAAPPLRLVE
jgi:hypothetical protein